MKAWILKVAGACWIAACCQGLHAEPPENAIEDPARWDIGDTTRDLRPLLDAMTAAVLAADVEGYLECVDLSDPIFAQEQRNWAKDFARVKAESFSVEVANAASDGTGRVAATMTMSWKVGGKQPIERKVSFPARFAEPADDVESPHGPWLFAGERWNEINTPHVRVCYADGLGEIARRVSELLPEVREHVHEGFGISVARPQTVKLYASMKHLQQSIYLSYADSLSGWNEPGESIKLLTGRRSGSAELKQLLAHEYGHVVTFEMGPKATLAPWWVLEGVAELAAEKYAGRAFERMVTRWAQQDKLVPWERMADFHNARDEDTIFVYNQGHHMLAYVTERFGRASRNNWLTSMAAGNPLDVATHSAFGITFAELDQQWRMMLAQGEHAPARGE